METTGNTIWGSALTPGQGFDLAVVIPTLLRPSLPRALGSVFGQNVRGTVQILVGIDAHVGTVDIGAQAARLPEHMALTVIDPGYSTGRNRGGLHDALGGSLRTVLSYLAHAPLVAYLDDDCWWAHDHLTSLAEAIRTRDWAYGLRWYVAPGTSFPLAADSFESVGPGRGAYAGSEGGFSDTSTLMLDKTRCEAALAQWSRAQRGHHSGRGADRSVFRSLLDHEKFGGTGKTTAFYEIDEADGMHAARLKHLRTRLKPLTGYRAFAQGQFIPAAAQFFRHHYLTGMPEHALAWACCGLSRAGDHLGARTLADRHAPNPADPALAALRQGAASTANDPATACAVAFFRGQRALIDGDMATAARAFEQAAATGGRGQPERQMAMQELRHLKDGSPPPQEP